MPRGSKKVILTEPLKKLYPNQTEGFVSVAMAVFIVIICMAFLGFIALRLYWTQTIQTQQRLDSCIQKITRKLIEDINEIESIQKRMRIERATVMATMGPESRLINKIAKAALNVEAGFRNAVYIRWKLRQSKWLIEKGCDKKNDLFFPLPNMPWKMAKNDWVGPQVWDLETHVLHIKLWSHPSYSASQIINVQKKDKINVNLRNPWVSHWTKWTSFY